VWVLATGIHDGSPAEARNLRTSWNLASRVLAAESSFRFDLGDQAPLEGALHDRPGGASLIPSAT